MSETDSLDDIRVRLAAATEFAELIDKIASSDSTLSLSVQAEDAYAAALAEIERLKTHWLNRIWEAEHDRAERYLAAIVAWEKWWRLDQENDNGDALFAAEKVLVAIAGEAAQRNEAGTMMRGRIR